MRTRYPMILALFTALLATSACESPNKNEAKPGEKATEGDEATADSSKEAAADEEACSKYREKFCEATGAQSQACASIKTIAGLLPPAACQAGLDDIAYTKAQLEELDKKCEELVSKLCSDLGEESESCKMVRQVTPKFPPERCQTMLSQYDDVLAELKAKEAQNKPLPKEKADEIAGDDAPSFGPKDAPVTIVEFSDFQCPYCSMTAQVTDEIKKNYPDKVRVVFRQFPLSFHEDAHLASQAALAAHEQGKFWEMHDKLFANQKALKRANLEEYAKEIGLNMDEFNEALDSKKFAKQVDEDMELGKEVYVQGTPTMFINGERVGNPTQFQAIKPEIEAALNDEGGSK